MVRGISEGDTAIRLYYISIWRVHPLDRGDCTLRKTKNPKNSRIGCRQGIQYKIQEIDY